MPELPDVEVFRRYLTATALHQPIERMEVRDDYLLREVSARTLRRHLAGRSLTGTRRHGKWLFADTDGDRWLILHFGMTGRLEYSKDPGRVPEHTRLLLHLAGGYHLAYDSRRKLGEVGLTGHPDAFIERLGLGPDALGLPRERLEEILDSRRGTLKGLLMNQEALAGLGNVYSDEVLFQAGLHPRREIGDLDRNDRARLHRQTQRVLEMSIDRKADADRFPATWLTPHRREGRPCPRCGTPIRKARIVGRPCYFCPGCQPPP